MKACILLGISRQSDGGTESFEGEGHHISEGQNCFIRCQLRGSRFFFGKEKLLQAASIKVDFSVCQQTSEVSLRGGGGKGVLPYMGYISMCRGIGYGCRSFKKGFHFCPCWHSVPSVVLR